MNHPLQRPHLRLLRRGYGGEGFLINGGLIAAAVGAGGGCGPETDYGRQS